MEIKYGVAGKQRKAMVTAIASIIGADAIYKGVPTCNYEVDYFTIDRSGTLIFDDSADSEKVEHLIEELATQGFVAEKAEPEGETIDNGFSVSIPIEKVNVFNGSLDCLDIFFDFQYHLRFSLHQVFAHFLRKSICLILACL